VAASFDHGFHTGWCADVMASHEGMECFAWEYHDDEPTGEHFEIGHLFAADGTDVAGEYGPPIGVNVVPVDWRSGDQQKEIFDGNCGGGDDPGAARCAVWPSRVGDVLGDSREEIVAYRPAFAALRVYANPEARAGRQVTPLADRGYRAGIARWGLGYMTNWVAAKTNQPRSDIVSPAGCGDGACGGGETCLSCPADCGACPPACGDGECAADESCAACPGDCGACPADDVAPDADASLLDTPAEVRDAAAEIPADGEAGGPPGGCTCAASGRSGPAPWAVLGLVLAAALRRRRTGLPARRGTPSRAPLRLPPSSPSSAAARPPRSSWRAMASASMPRKVAARATPRSGTGRPG
jgi:MYXO-CTERM domain-containing protein